MSDDGTTSAPVSFRKVGQKKRPAASRKRADSPPKAAEADNSDDADASDHPSDGSSPDSSEPAPVKVKRTVFNNRSRRLKKNPLLVKSKPRGNPGKERSSSSDGSSSSSEDSEEEEERRRAREIDVTVKSSNTAESEVPKDMGATKVSEHDTAHEQDYQAQFERVQQRIRDEQEQGPSSSGQKVYRGLKMYGAKEAKDTTKGKASSGLNHYGPIRGQQFMRASVRWDYAPDICKDYKETGFCTFGDSCKFLHDRSDYKHGWEIEQDWQREQQARKDEPEPDYTVFSDED